MLNSIYLKSEEIPYYFIKSLDKIKENRSFIYV